MCKIEYSLTFMVNDISGDRISNVRDQESGGKNASLGL